MQHPTLKYRGSLAVATAALALVVLAGCTPAAGPTEEAGSTPEPTPIVIPETADEISATFPIIAEWHKSYATGEACTEADLTSYLCVAEGALAVRASSGSQLRGDAVDRVAESTGVGLTQWNSDDEGAAAIATSRADIDTYNGDFDIPADPGAGFMARVVGAGTVVDLEFGAWSGFRLDYTLTASGEQVQEQQRSATMVMLGNGPLVYRIQLNSPPADAEAADAEVDYWLERNLAGEPYEATEPAAPSLAAVIEPAPTTAEEAVAGGRDVVARYIALQNEYIATGIVDVDSISTVGAYSVPSALAAEGATSATEGYIVTGEARFEETSGSSHKLIDTQGELENGGVSYEGCYITTDRTITLPDGTAVEATTPDRAATTINVGYDRLQQGWRVSSTYPSGEAC